MMTRWAAIAAVALACLATPSAARAQTSGPLASDEVAVALSLDDVIARVALHDPDVARARFDRQERTTRMAMANAVLSTAINAGADVQRARQLVDSGLSSGTSINERYSLSFGVSRRLAPGTTLSLSLEQGVSRSVFPLSTEFFSTDIENGPNVDTALTLSMAQPLLRGRGRDVVLFGLAIAQQQVDALEPAAAQSASQTLLDVLGAWVELDYAWRAWEAAAISVDRAEAQREAAIAQLGGGRVAQIEVDLAEQRVLAATESLFVARQAVRTASRALEAHAGALDAPVRPVGSFEIPTGPASCTEAVERNPSVALLRESIDLATVQLTQTRDGLRPSLDLSAGVTASGLDPGYFTALGQMATLDARSFFAGLVFSMPLGNLAARSEHELAQVALDRAQYEVEAAEQTLCRELDAATDAAELVDARLALAEQRRELAERSLQAQQALFEGGYSTVQAGLDALDQADAAALEVLRLQADAALARLRAAWIGGSLVDLAAPVAEAM